MLEGKKVLIIGSSGGIGVACAKECMAEGAIVCGTYRTYSERIEELEEKYPKHFISKQLDLSQTDSISPVIKGAIRDMGGIDILINAAGITCPELLFLAKAQNWERVISSNLLGSFYIIQSIIVPMISNKGGSIINISSVFGVKGGVGQSSYCASKAGMIGLTKAVALEVANKNIRVNAIAPGYIETDMTSKLDEKYKQQCIESIPMGRFGTAKEVAELCVFLASNKATYITGQTFVIDGGLTV